jgi:hypothetical protein
LLAEIKNIGELAAWLRTQPREVSVAFAARVALRVLPILHDSRVQGFKVDFFADIVLPVFRATGVAWAVAKYPHQAAKREAATYAVAAIRAATAIHAAADADAAIAAARSTHAAYNASPSLRLNVSLAAKEAVAAFWSAVSDDARLVEEGGEIAFMEFRGHIAATASRIAGSPLWPQGQPDELQTLWQELKAALLAMKQDWQVWTIWYDDRLAGRVRAEERELAYVRIEEALWQQGPAVVNAEIKRRIEELEPHHHEVQQDTGSIAFGSGSASMSVTEHAPRDPLPPEPSPELGPVLQVTERGLEIISQPSGDDFDVDLQKALHDRLRRLLPTLTDATHKVDNKYPALDHVVSEYSDLIARPFDQLDVASLWAVGTGLLAFRAAFTNQPSGTMTEPLEPGLLALLQQAAEIHGGFILGFQKDAN